MPTAKISAKPKRTIKRSPRVRRRPGAKCVRSGQYIYEDVHGERVEDEERTISRGETMPPPPAGMRGGIWELRDATRHRSGR